MLNFINLGFIKMIFPKAKIIHVKRNSMDNCFSIYSLRFNGHQPFAYNQFELGKYYKMYEKMMFHWSNIFPNNIYEVSYESLVRDLNNEVKGIIFKINDLEALVKKNNTNSMLFVSNFVSNY